SAFGLLVADVRHDEVRTRVTRTAELEFAELQRLFGELTARARARLAEDGFAPAAMRVQASLDMRYVGQAFELAVPFDAGLAAMQDVDRAFYTAHEARYAHATADPVEIVSLRVSAYGVGAKPSLPHATKDGSVPAARLTERAVLFDAVPTATAVYARDRLPSGAALEGPALIAQSEDIGAHVVPLPWSVRSAMAEFGSDLAPGDVILLNDPYRGGTHLNDVTLIYPVFEDGRLILFPAVREHWADVGGMVPGSLSGEATEIYQEGMRIPPIKIVERGTLNRAAMALILSNMRVPDEREGDFHAGLAACKTAER